MPVDRGSIDAQLREIGEGERWWEQREFRDLPYILDLEERLRGITTGRVLFSRTPSLSRRGRWLLVVTNQRVLCLKQERFSRRQVDISFGEIVRLHQRNRLRAHQITIDTLDRGYRLLIAKADAFRFVGALSTALPQPPKPRLSPELEPLSWIPGLHTVAALPGVAGIVSKVSLLSPPDRPASDRIERLERTISLLRDDVDRLQEQVEFLEGILRKKSEEAFAPPSTMDS
jgi:Bacterial PH domain